MEASRRIIHFSLDSYLEQGEIDPYLLEKLSNNQDRYIFTIDFDGDFSLNPFPAI